MVEETNQIVSPVDATAAEAISDAGRQIGAEEAFVVLLAGGLNGGYQMEAVSVRRLRFCSSSNRHPRGRSCTHAALPGLINGFLFAGFRTMTAHFFGSPRNAQLLRIA